MQLHSMVCCCAAELLWAGVLRGIRTREIMLSPIGGRSHAAAQHGVLLCC